MRSTRSRFSGFTIIELAVVSCVASVLLFALYMSFASGMRLWRRFYRPEPQEDVRLFAEKFSRDVRNTLGCRSIPFIAEERKVAFPALTTMNAYLPRRTPGEVAYFFDSKRDAVLRSERDFSRMYAGSEGVISPVLMQVKDAKFSYYVFNKEKKIFEWLDEISDGSIPAAVRIFAEFAYDKKKEEFVQTISIPIANR